MKKKIMKAGILIVVFCAAVIISSLVINKDVSDEAADMGAASLPEISFYVGETEVNPLFGYVNKMEIPAVRDTITPLKSDGSLTVKVEKYGNKIDKLKYEVYSLDGTKKHAEGKADIVKETSQAELDLKGILSSEEPEAVLKVTLDTPLSQNGKTAGYYTRIVRPKEVTTDQCLAFAKDFHTKALNKEATEELTAYLEPDEKSDNTTYQTVNIHSDITHIQWGDMKPSVIGDVEWDIKESNTVYTSILAKYKVSCTDEEGAESIYNVKEFFRVRFLVDTIYLLDYNRNMEQVFDGRESDFDENGIILGIIPKDISYEINKDQTSAAFVQAGELWLYESKKGNLTKVFSMPDQEGRDTRGENDQHAVRVIGIDNKNNITFAVYGYMARGSHEGEVGVGIYYYDAAENKIEEKSFITSTKSFAIAEDELGKMVYYNQSTSLLHVLADGTLYRIDLKKDEKKVLAENLTDERYAVSDDGHLMVYQTGGKTDKSATLHIMNLKSGEDYTIKAEDGENLRPLGFINGDFIYGKVNPADTGITVSGEEITPMYEVQIRNSKNKEAAQYNFTEQSIYTTDVLIDGNLLTFNRVIKDGETYNSTKQEYVTNNEERKESKIVFETYVSENTGKQMRFTFADGVKKKQKQNEKPIYQPGKKTLTIELKGKEKEEKYYVYGMGELAAVYNKAGYAVQKAEQVSGVVISSEQKYVWEKGNRDLVYSTEAGKFQCEEGESSLDACERYMEQYHAQRLDLTGCSLDQMLYVINRGCPMIAILESAHAVLLTGYTMTDITYVDPSTGESYTVGMSEMENMTEAGGNTFIGYIR